MAETPKHRRILRALATPFIVVIVCGTALVYLCRDGLLPLWREVWNG